MSRLHRKGDRVLIRRGPRVGQQATVTDVDVRMRRYRVDGQQGTYEEESVQLIKEIKPKIFSFKVLFDNGQGCTGFDNMIVFDCVFSVYENVSAQDKAFWGERFKKLLPHLGKWLAMMQDMKDADVAYPDITRVYDGNYTAEEIEALPDDVVYDVFLHGNNYDVVQTRAMFREVQVFE